MFVIFFYLNIILLGYKRLKYPTINCKETALKFIAISLKALNPNKDVVYR